MATLAHRTGTVPSATGYQVAISRKPHVRLLRGTFVDCPQCGELRMLLDHLLVVDEQGFISHLESADSASSKNLLKRYPEDLKVLPNGSFFLPNFVDLHLHAPQFLYQGTGLHLPLMKWLDEYAFKAEEKLDADPALARKVYTRLAERLIENGTGSVLFFGTIKAETNLILAEVMQQVGVRAFVGKLSMDISSRPTYIEPSAPSSLSSISSFISSCTHLVQDLPQHERLVEPVITPRFVPTCSDELLTGLGELSQKTGVRIQSHLAEAYDQVEWVRSERGMEDIEVFSKHNLLTPRTIQAHCTFLPPSSLSALSSYGTAVAHCPLSNAYFSALPFRLREALNRGVKVGLGTDIAGGYSVDIMNAMRQAVSVSRMREGERIIAQAKPRDQSEQEQEQEQEGNLSIDWKEALYLATRGGQRALGYEDRGIFEVGAPFDAQQIVIFDETGTGVGPIDMLEPDEHISVNMELLEKWWCLGDSENRAGMYVQGSLLMGSG